MNRLLAIDLVLIIHFSGTKLWPLEAMTKFADVRIYPRSLTSLEVKKIALESKWTNGKPMKQCYDAPSAKSASSLDWERNQQFYMDSVLPDEMGNDCNFYAQQMKINPVSHLFGPI